VIPGRGWVGEEGEQQKAQRLDAFVGGVDAYSTLGFFAVAMNNVRLNAVAKYYNQVPTFEKLIKDCGYDLEKVFEKVEQIGTE
jgi:predicted aminopeptidase